MAGITSTSPRGLFGTPKVRRRPPPRPCWLCGVVDVAGKPDAHRQNQPLCRLCWPEQPSAYDAALRSSSALRVALGLDRQLSAVVQSRVAELARRLGIVAHCDLEGAVPNERRFQHVDLLVLIEAQRQLDVAGGGGRP